MDRDLFEIHADLERRHWWFVGRRRILRSIVGAIVPPGEDAGIVDIGCGTGGTIAAFAPDYRASGIDPSSDAIELARARHPGVDFEVGEASSAAARLASASGVLLCDVLEHVADDFLLLSIVLGPMAPGAHLVVTVPARPELWSGHDIAMGHYRRYTKGRLELTWDGLPVEVRLLSHFNARLYPLVWVIRAMSGTRSRGVGQGGTDLFIPPWPLNGLLSHVLGGERRRLLRRLEGSGAGYTAGASLLAVLRRKAGQIDRCSKPPSVQPDRYAPRVAT